MQKRPTHFIQQNLGSNSDTRQKSPFQGNPHIHQHFKNYWTGQVLLLLETHIHILSSWF